MNDHKLKQDTNQDFQFSTVDFKKPSADLHRMSRYIFLASLVLSITVTAIILTWSLPVRKIDKVPTIPAVVLLVESIPETRQSVETPAPVAPFTPAAMPLPVDDIMPDDVTIEDTELVLDAPPSLPPIVVAEGAGDDEALEQVYEFYAVEEAPERLTDVAPVYPPLAVRTGIGGTVTLKVLVNTEGTVDSVVVMDGSEMLVDAAVDAAHVTTFKPARHLDRPVACWVLLPYRFTPPR